MKKVNNYVPHTKDINPIAFVGEAPSIDEEREGVPFVGTGGRILRSMCQSVGLPIERALIGNVCQYKPLAGDMVNMAWDSDEYASSRAELRNNILAFNPNLVVLMGNAALHCAKSHNSPKVRAGKLVYPFPVSDWRGAFFKCDVETSPFYGFKCLPTYHPSACLRMYEWMPILRLDLHKAVQGSRTPAHTVPSRNIDLNTEINHVIHRLEQLHNHPYICLDIEGGVNGLKCISFATSPSDVFIVPMQKMSGDSYWPDVDSEMRVWRAVADVLQNPRVAKILQNSLYDNFVLSYSFKCPIVNVADDTMLAHWERLCELEKNLGFQASIYTNEPYYKGEITSSDSQRFWTYCCRDSAVSFEIRNVLDTKLSGAPKEHYKFNVEMLRPLLYMELRGIRYNVQGAKARADELQIKSNDYCEKLYMISGRPIATSGKGFTSFLYDELGLPPQKNRITGGLTANYEALLKLVKKTNHPVCHLAMRIRALKTRIQMLSITADDDGRIRCGYNIVGTETGRLTCYTSPTGSGYNLQTIPEYDRDLFVADVGCHFFQCDLSGADGWTVAAHCSALADDTMLEDYYYGLKPAKLLALGLKYGPQILSCKDRNELLERSNEIIKSDWQYFVCKIAQHGSNYLMGGKLLASQILIQSEGKVVVDESYTNRVQELYFRRYPGVKRWHAWMGNQIKTHRCTTSASGHIRQYFGRTDEILGAALANEPQENTTYATNLAAHRLWYSEVNRKRNQRENTEGGSSLVNGNPHSILRIEPLHQVHDALCGQFRIEDTSWATDQIKSFFDNELTIAGIKLRIPFEGGYGPSWGQCKNKI